MKRFLLLTALLAFATASTPARAEDAAAPAKEVHKIKYLQDPVFEPMFADDRPPMSDLIDLAKAGDTRAQFILGDLYAKGKGGLAKNGEQGRHWFEESAKAGYGPAFIRLAALAKDYNKPVEAYSWYELGAEFATGADQKYARKARDEFAKTLTDAQIDEAGNMSDKWKQERIHELNERRAAEKAKAEAEKQAAAAAQDSAAKQESVAKDAAPVAAGDAKAAAKPAKKQSTKKKPAAKAPVKEEIKYND